MTRRGYDSTSAGACPHDGEVYGGYIDGTYSGNYAEQKRLHPEALVFSIGRFTTSRADFYDCENGLLSPAQAAGLAKGNLDRGEFAGCYCNESTWPKLRAALVSLKILNRVAIWLAWEEYSKDDTIPGYAVGRQFLLFPGLSPGHFDVSNWADHIPGLDPPLKPVKPRHLPVHVSAALGLTRRWCDRYTRTATRPLAETAKVRLKRLAASATAATKVKP